ncbi:iron complex transport system permease protein [Methanofollis sp. W23]|uniref:FecCD family ABC transporter permease n=1 Tax=Methanofollis sp. W23 TaxID=2817849 RepID=UPI001AE45DF2|nr:iron chelate uptake ABC transporter family permease subunit [Methanofollis sp. W23]MBP2146507.1 iron complex transport system permease protein [Methanofollis sp. W23]
MQKKTWIVLVTLILILGISIILTTAIGTSGLSLLDLGPAGITQILFDVRLPRVLAALLVGAGLAAAGTAMQGLFKNSMADPYIIGTSSGGALGASLSIVFLMGWGLPVFAFIGATASTIVVYLISRRDGRVAVETLLLSGIAVSLFLSALLSFVMYISGKSLHQIMFWLMGGLWNVWWDDVKVAALILVGCIMLFFFARDLNVISLGEEDALHLGVDVEKLKLALLLLSSFITGIAVSVAGAIGFIGLITPHVMRIIVGPDHRVLLPSAMMAGAVILMWADTLARTMPNEIPVGIVTAFFGAPFFIYLLRSRTRT